MRIRLVGIAALMFALLGLVGYSLLGSYVLAQSGTPAAPPLAELTPAGTTSATPLAETAATPVAEPVRVVTLVGWYQNSASGDLLEIGALQTTDELVGGPGDPTSPLTGKADPTSEAKKGLPSIVLGAQIPASSNLLTLPMLSTG